MINFMGVPAVPLKNARFVVLSLPYEKTTSYGKGTARGPQAILAASTQVELFDEELSKTTYQAGIHTINSPPLNFKKKPEVFLPQLTGYVEKLLQSKEWTLGKKMLVSFGGEHSLTPALVRAFKECGPSEFSVLHLDAHSDLRAEYEGSRYNHASAVRRVSELCPVTQVGIRSITEDHYEITEKNKNIKTYLAHQTRPVTQHVKGILDSLRQNVYVTVDLDVFDPSVMPGVGTPEPGGLGWYEVLEILRPVFQTKNVISFDIVELCPIPRSNISEFTAAKLAYRMMGYTL